jgi:hypothetical protein
VITIKTISGSTYEINTVEKKIRRVEGTHAPTSRQGNDGEWKDYTGLASLKNYGIFIDWHGDGKGTITSMVTSHTHEELTSLLT